MQTGLTEPYRQLNDAYAQISQAYADTAAAYNHTKAVYDHAQSELAILSSLSDQWVDSYNTLQLKNHPWRVPQALRLMTELRGKINAFKDASSRDKGSGDISSPDKE